MCVGVHQDNIEIFAEKLVRGKVGRLGLEVDEENLVMVLEISDDL